MLVSILSVQAIALFGKQALRSIDEVPERRWMVGMHKLNAQVEFSSRMLKLDAGLADQKRQTRFFVIIQETAWPDQRPNCLIYACCKLVTKFD